MNKKPFVYLFLLSGFIFFVSSCDKYQIPTARSYV